jgi:hypothetical protein
MNEESSTALKSAVLGFVNWDLSNRLCPTESFGRAFSKARADPTRAALVAARTRRNYLGVSFLPSFFLAPTVPKKKAGNE